MTDSRRFSSQQARQSDGSLNSAYWELGLSAGASAAEVKSAYRRLALKCHPDLHQKDSTEFLRLTAAYERIIDKDVHTRHVASPQSHGPSMYRAYPTLKRFDSGGGTVWGLGLALGCVLFGSVLLWSRAQLYHDNYYRRGASRVVEPTKDALKRERIAALLLENRLEQKKKVLKKDE